MPNPVVDPRIDVFAQRALLRMFGGPMDAQSDASQMLAAIKAGTLAGIYKEDEQVPAKVARRLGTGWWQLIPSGQDAAYIEDPAGSPIIVFRDGVRSNKDLLDPALRRAWAAFKAKQTPPEPLPTVTDFFARPAANYTRSDKPQNLLIPRNSAIALYWAVKNAESVRLREMTLAGVIRQRVLPTSGRIEITPTEGVTYSLVAIGVGGTIESNQYVTVQPYKPPTRDVALAPDVTGNLVEVIPKPQRATVTQPDSVAARWGVAAIAQGPQFQRPPDAGLRDSLRGPWEEALLYWYETADRLSNRDPLALRSILREHVVLLMQQIEGFGYDDKNAPGRQKAYIDILFWGRNETEIMRASFKECSKKQSSCGLVVRSLWLLLGARDASKPRDASKHPIDPPYQYNVMINLREFAKAHNALKQAQTDKGLGREDFLNCSPKPGDAVFIWKGHDQHVFTLIDVQNDRFISIDGGQSGPGNRDGCCCGIERRERTLASDSHGPYAMFEGDPRPIMAVVNLEKLIPSFVAPHVILLKTANLAGIGIRPTTPKPNPDETLPIQS